MKKWHQLVCAMFVGVLALGGAMVQPALAGDPADMEPGSFLIYPLFDIRSANQTKIRITNNGGLLTDVHITVICPGKTVTNDTIYDPHCAATDRKITLTPHQTAILAVGLPFVPTGAFPGSPASNTAPVYEFGLPAPCSEGYIVAYAQSAPDATGAVFPRAYNALYGDYQIIYANSDIQFSFPGGPGLTVEAGPAIAIQSQAIVGTNLGVHHGGGLVDLAFGGATPDYSAVPTFLLGDFAAIGGNLSPGPVGFFETDTRFIVLVLDVLADGNNPVARVGGTVWDAKENPFSVSRNFICWTRFSGSNPGFGGIFSRALIAGGALDADYGSFKFSLNDGGGNIGGTYNPAGFGAIEEVSNLAGSRGNTIRNMHHTVGNKATVLTVDTANTGP